jgi:hypothetical protein
VRFVTTAPYASPEVFRPPIDQASKRLIQRPQAAALTIGGSSSSVVTLQNSLPKPMDY